MMKKVLFALAVLCTSFWSCNTLDLNDVGYGDVWGTERNVY